MTIIDQITKREVEKMSKTEAMKELERYRSMDRHSMSFTYKGYDFSYVEWRDRKPVICISKRFDPSIGVGKPVEDIHVKPFNRRSFETWCVCWFVDNGEKDG